MRDLVRLQLYAGPRTNQEEALTSIGSCRDLSLSLYIYIYVYTGPGQAQALTSIGIGRDGGRVVV